MSTIRKVSAALAISTALLLSACGGGTTPAADGDAGSLVTVKVGASPAPHAKILEFVQKELAADAGIKLEIVEFDDFVLPNEALASGEIDANYFQHLPYLEDQIKEKGYEFDHGEGIHIEPYAAFSSKYDSLADVPDGATIAITNDAANQIRGLRVLEAEGQLKDVADDSNVLSLTPEQNPRGFKFAENQPEVIVQQLEDPAIDVAFVNGNFILTAGLNTDDAIAKEAVEGNPNANLLAWRSNNTNEGVAKLDELLHSDEVAAFIKETWPSGDVIAGN
ncbi:MetQ/NlpA family ABC transporter substrate-binding protein [Tessaracoccus antarcticus]|uniref:ABC transporter n=1 Tax=Tessaracoccus antarcticus TaxID=2479848 RepID=A0A3M0GKG7_9ACTN|nr:MetQ/NlpA family ABC transporter substrate-binding protein [Tessaracoccus antarcticus]RMB62103.1 ABC transporter [Tessaracoccus antarcticus]